LFRSAFTTSMQGAPVAGYGWDLARWATCLRVFVEVFHGRSRSGITAMAWAGKTPHQNIGSIFLNRSGRARPRAFTHCGDGNNPHVFGLYTAELGPPRPPPKAAKHFAGCCARDFPPFNHGRGLAAFIHPEAFPGRPRPILLKNPSATAWPRHLHVGILAVLGQWLHRFCRILEPVLPLTVDSMGQELLFEKLKRPGWACGCFRWWLFGPARSYLAAGRA